MRVWIFTLAFSTALWAADPEQLALALKAQSDFDRVELAAAPTLPQASACVQSQAALLPVVSREDLPLIAYRKGICELANGVITAEASSFNAAAADFEKAIENWDARAVAHGKNHPGEPLASALPVLAAVARLKAGVDTNTIAAAERDITVALSAPACPASIMPATACQADLNLGREWLGWIALRHGDLSAAAGQLAPFPGSAWAAWVAGRQTFQNGNYSGAASHYRHAIDVWEQEAKEPAPTFLTRLSPPVEMAQALTDLGGAQLLAGNTTAAIATLDAAVKADPSAARAFYYRARARELSGQTDAALADYNLASRAAFAGAQDLVSGEAHLYRGILLYRRKDFARAEDEFASALNFEIPPLLHADAAAWRHLAAVSSGACGASLTQLNASLPAVSPFFPKQEAVSAAATCAATASAANSPK